MSAATRAFLCLSLAACTPEIAAYKPLDLAPARDLDILFVIDDSSDRGNYDAMASQLDVLQSQLTSVDGQLPSLHVGVVTTDLGVSGTNDLVPVASVGSCIGFGRGGQLQPFGAQTTRSYLEDLRGPGGTRTRNFASGDLGRELRALTNPSVSGGCDYQQPLEAMRRALDPETNPGFIRPGAMLAVVFLTNEDDCSLATGALLDPRNAALGPPTKFRCTAQGVVCDPDDPGREGRHDNCRPREGSGYLVDVSEYATFLEQFKANPRDVVVSAVAGPRDNFLVRNVGSPVLQPSCQGVGGPAYPAVRIGALVDHFGGALVDGCTQAAAYQQLSAPIVGRQRSCFPSLRLADGEDCNVMDVTSATAGEAETEVEIELAQCMPGDAGPCWYRYADPAGCPDGDNLGIAVRRGASAAPAGSRIRARCFAP